MYNMCVSQQQSLIYARKVKGRPNYLMIILQYIPGLDACPLH